MRHQFSVRNATTTRAWSASKLRANVKKILRASRAMNFSHSFTGDFFTIHNFRVQCYSSTHLLYCWSCFRGSCGPFSSESPSPEHANRLPSLSTCNPTISESVYPTFSFLNFPTDLTDYFPANKTNMLANTLYNKSSFPTKRQEFLNVFSWHQVIFSDKGHFFSRA